MTNLLSIVDRIHPPVAWAEGDNIPWNDPAFSERMLAYHLDQSHDLASRRLETIERHVCWIHDEVLEQQPSRVLDLTCGPGLYTSRLAQRGHRCVGVDFAPAAIAYARMQADKSRVDCTYFEADVRSFEPSVCEGFDLVMMLWGQFNVFRKHDAATLLKRARRALRKDGRLLLEPQELEHLERAASAPPAWRTELAGLFSDQPHLVLEESHWDDREQIATNRFFVIDAHSNEVVRYAMSTVGYTRGQLGASLADAGYRDVRCFPNLTGAREDTTEPTFVVVARV